ncbi:sensor histidine kinase [Paenibacillus rigui]|nr:ATP-binding protein [Paenibacillus rigui]
MRNKPIRVQFLLVFLSFLVLLIGFIFIVNAFFLKPFYVWTKTEQLKSVSRKFDNVPIDSQNQDFRSLMEVTLYEDQASMDIFSAEGRIKYSTRNPRELHPIDFKSLFSRTEWERMQQGEMIVQEKNDFRRNQEFLTVYRALPNGEYLALSSAVAAIQQSVTILNEFLLLVLVLFLVLAWIWATRFANYFSRPIVTLQQMTNRMTQFDFSQHWMEPRRDELGNLGNNMNKLMSIIGQFIEELKGKNELLESELERKNSMERMRKQFVSNVSHELKTPIALIQGYAEGLRQNVNEDPASRNEYCDVIIDEARKMNELVRELLLLSQLELGRSVLKPEAFHIESAIQTAVSRLQGLYAERGIQFELAFQEHEGDVIGDAGKINQVLNNYLSNAVFFLNEHKRIRIETRITGNRLRVSVFNTGPHIPEEEMELIWTSFYKVDKARTRGEGGTGLGLSIVQRIMDLHEMGYGAANADGGVTFWFELPLAGEES